MHKILYMYMYRMCMYHYIHLWYYGYSILPSHCLLQMPSGSKFREGCSGGPLVITYRISLNISPGFYFLPGSGDLASKRDQALHVFNRFANINMLYTIIPGAHEGKERATTMYTWVPSKYKFEPS